MKKKSSKNIILDIDSIMTTVQFLYNDKGKNMKFLILMMQMH